MNVDPFDPPADAAGPLHRFSHAAMATTFEVLVPGDDGEYCRRAAAAAFERLDELEAALTRFDPYSDVSRINACALGESVRVGLDAWRCLELAAEVSADTAGAFDVTYGSAAGGAGRLMMDEATMSVGPTAAGVAVDLGGIGKGYAVDRLAEVLADWQLPAALVHGGFSTALGIGAGWQAPLRDPSDASRSLCTIELAGRALSGSGPGAHGGHVIDPRTGRPAAPDRLAAWAVAPTAALADALSTAFLVMDAEAIRRYCEGRRQVGGMRVARSAGRPIEERFGTFEALNG